MSNENVIIEILKSVQSQVGDMQTQIGDMQIQIGDMQTQINNLDTKVDRLDAKVQKLDTKVEILSERVTNVELHLENTTDRNIGLLMEQHKPNADKLDRMIEQTEVMQFDLDQLKKVVISHSSDLNILMQR